MQTKNKEYQNGFLSNWMLYLFSFSFSVVYFIPRNFAALF